jgi:hypothetical protein
MMTPLAAAWVAVLLAAADPPPEPIYGSDGSVVGHWTKPREFTPAPGYCERPDREFYALLLESVGLKPPNCERRFR